MTKEFDAENYTTLELMRSGKWYLPKCNEPEETRRNAARLVRKLNDSSDEMRQQDILAKLLGGYTPATAEVETPIYIQYGVNTYVGEGARIQANVTIMDSAEVRIGAGATISTNCQLYTAIAPVHDAEMRSYGWKRAEPITIGEDAWLGPGVTVLPGVTIGARSVIAAGSVVARDIPPNSIASGNPAQVRKGVNPGSDSERYELPAGVPFDLGKGKES